MKIKQSIPFGIIKPADDPEALHAELLRLAQQHKCLSPRVVLQAARDPNNPLHAAFEWSDDAAAEQWRLHQARALIRSVRVVQPDTQDERRVFVHVSKAEHYQTVEAVAQSPLMFASALRLARERVAQANDSLQELEAIAKSEAQPDDTLMKLSIAVQAMTTARHAVAALH